MADNRNFDTQTDTASVEKAAEGLAYRNNRYPIADTYDGEREPHNDSNPNTHSDIGRK